MKQNYAFFIMINYVNIFVPYSNCSKRDHNNKKNFNKNEGRCSAVKTQKPCEQGQGANIGPKIKLVQGIYHMKSYNHKCIKIC